MKWTKEKCVEEALKCKTRKEFYKNFYGAYCTARRNKWLNDVCSHMIEIKKPNGYWTKETCKEESLKYKTRNEFQKKSGSAYVKSLENKWLDQICSHMFSLTKQSGYWTKERCKDAALCCENRSDLVKKFQSAYNSARNNNWLDDICSHMIEKIKPRGYWTEKICKEESLKYTTKKEFSEKSPSAYNKAKKLKIIDDICSHMISCGNLYKRCIYSYEFSDNHVYVGLTYNLKKRDSKRKYEKKDAVTLHTVKTKLQPILIQWTNYIDVKEAKIKEGEYVKKYKDLSWIILNKTKTGGVGGDILKWTKEKCQEESLKYKIRSEFQKKSISAYCAAQRNKWLDEICSHMIPFTKPRKYWTFNRCKEEALKYKNKSEFRKKSQAYYSGWNNKWLDEICSHMTEIKKPKNYWSFDRCKEEALKYKTRKEFYNKSNSAYSKSLFNKWLNDICSHMIKKS